MVAIHAYYGIIPVLDSSGGSPDDDLYCDVTADSYDGGSADIYDGAFAGGCTGAPDDMWDGTFAGG